jgi:hypothetical protein
MSEENVEIVKRAIAAVNERDVDAYLSCCTKDVQLSTPWPRSRACTRGLMASAASSPT